MQVWLVVQENGALYQDWDILGIYTTRERAADARLEAEDDGRASKERVYGFEEEWAEEWGDEADWETNYIVQGPYEVED